MLPPLWIPQKRPKKRGRPTGLEGGIGHPHQAKRQADGLISGAGHHEFGQNVLPSAVQQRPFQWDLKVIQWDLMRIFDGIPSGHLSHSYGKWPSDA